MASSTNLAARISLHEADPVISFEEVPECKEPPGEHNPCQNGSDAVVETVAVVADCGQEGCEEHGVDHPELVTGTYRQNYDGQGQDPDGMRHNQWL